jgi:hypothetical protein
MAVAVVVATGTEIAQCQVIQRLDQDQHRGIQVTGTEAQQGMVAKLLLGNQGKLSGVSNITIQNKYNN